MRGSQPAAWSPVVATLALIGALAVWSAWPTRLSRVAPQVFDEPFWTEADSTLTGEELSNIEIYSRASPATVHITSTVLHRNWFLEIYPSESTGSGFLVDSEGRILTNYHVIQGSAELEITLLSDEDDGSRYIADVIATDPSNDLALIQIQSDRPMPFLTLGDSDAVQVGQKVLAIGNPFGLEGNAHDRGGQLHRPLHPGPERGPQGPDPDRRGHQPRQQRRTAARLGRQRDRHQHGDLRAERKHRDRLRDAGQPRKGAAALRQGRRRAGAGSRIHRAVSFPALVPRAAPADEPDTWSPRWRGAPRRPRPALRGANREVVLGNYRSRGAAI